jgi:hypothetical protein
MDTEIIDNLDGTCVKCGQMHPSDKLLLAEIRVGLETYRKEYWSGNISSIMNYRMNANAIQMEICLSCIRKKRMEQWRNILLAEAAAAFIVLLDLLIFGTFTFLGSVGVIIGFSILIAIPKLNYSDISFSDAVARKLFLKSLPEEVRKDRKFRVFTRKEMKNME